MKAGGFKSIALDWQTVTSLDVGGGAAKRTRRSGCFRLSFFRTVPVPLKPDQITTAVVRVAADAYSTGNEVKNGYMFVNYNFNTAITRSRPATVTVRRRALG